MAKRKTISVDRILEMGNHFLLHSDDKLRGERQGVCNIIEQVLSESGRYNGFQYLRDYHMAHSERGKTLGIIFDPLYHHHSYPDDSRREYGIKPIKERETA